MDWIPVRDRVLVKPLEEENLTSSGFVIANEKDRPIKGKVLGVGSGKITIDGSIVPMEVLVGDTIYYGSWSGQLIKVEGEDFVILKEEDVLAIIERGQK